MDGDGWQISEGVTLLGMGRRAIQRSCGQNPASGDLGIVRVDGGKPGRRSYGADELAQIHLVNAMNQDGMDLASVRDAFERARSSDGVGRLAERRCELDLERAEAAEARLRRDRALASRGDARKLGELVEREVVDGGLYDEARANAEANLKAMFAAALGDQVELTVVFREA